MTIPEKARPANSGRRSFSGRRFQAIAWATLRARIDADAEPHEENDPGDQEVPAGVVLFGDRSHGGLGRSAAEPEVAGGILKADAILVHPEAEHGGEDQPEGHEPEEESVREPAGEQPRGSHSLALERRGGEIRAGYPLAGPAAGPVARAACLVSRPCQPRARRRPLGGIRRAHGAPRGAGPEPWSRAGHLQLGREECEGGGPPFGSPRKPVATDVRPE